MSPFDHSAGSTDPTAALNDTGKQAVGAAVASTLAKCAAATLLCRRHCPQRE